MINITSNIEDVNVSLWNNFIISNQYGNFFQSSEYYFALLQGKKYKPIVIFATQDNHVVGVLLAVIQKEPLGPFSFLSARAIIHGGPIAKDNNPHIINLLIKKCNELVKYRVVYTQIRNIFDTSNFSSTLEANGYLYEEHLNIIVDLEKTEEELWKELHSKRRNEIRKAIKEGTQFEVIATKEIINQTYDILCEVYSRAGLPLPSIEFFNSMYKKLGSEIFKVFVAKYNNKIIGTMYAFCFNTTIFDWYAGAYKEYYNKYPNDIIPWNVFVWGKNKGFKKFDFGGAGKPNVKYGVRDYKKKFGGDLVNFGRYQKVNSSFKMKISSIGFSIFRKLKKA